MASLSTLVLTFNCGRELIKADVFSRHLVDELPAFRTDCPEIIVISLQELAPIAYAFLGGHFLQPYLSRVYQTIDLAGKAWGHQYWSLLTRNIGMTAIMVFARADVIDSIRRVEAGGTGVGWYETGNKGAVGIRIGYAIRDDIVDLTFVAMHLAPHETWLKSRNEDWMNIVRRLIFTPVDGKRIQSTRNPRHSSSEEDAPLLHPSISDNEENLWSGIYSPTSHIVLAGDLNYRTSDRKPTPEDYESYPAPMDSDCLKLLRSDQLRTEIRAERTMHGFSEAEINFPPTYKYSNKRQIKAGSEETRYTKGSAAEFDKESEFGWAMHRWPSWCDRILYRELPPWVKNQEPLVKISVHKYTSLPLMSTSDHRPVIFLLSIPLEAIPPPPKGFVEKDWHISPPYTTDPEWRQKRAAARRREFAIGLLAYLGLTWEGNGFLVATVLGALGGWAIIRSILLSTGA